MTTCFLARGKLEAGRGSEIFEAVDFPFGESAEFAERDVEGEGAELDPLDFFHEEADSEEHAADLAIAAFDEGDLVPGILDVLEEADFCGREFDAALVVKSNGDAVAEFLDGGFVGLAADFDVISFGNVGAGLGEFLGEGAVVGEEEETFASVVEAADGVDAFGEMAEELHNSGAAFGIAGGGDVAFGLVQ